MDRIVSLPEAVVVLAHIASNVILFGNGVIEDAMN